MLLEPTTVNCVIYHAHCSDGYGAAFAARKCLGNRAEYYAAVHGQPPPDVVGKNVAILDFSYDNATIKQMINDANSLVIIDHHKSALIELHDISEAMIDLKHSGAMLAWNFFHPGKEAPKLIKYIEDADLWKWELPYSKEFSASFSMIPFEFEEFDKFCDDSVIDDAIKRGSYILAYSKTVIKKISEKAERKTFNGHDVLVVNSAHWKSELGNVLAQDCDFAVIWDYSHKYMCVNVSLRSFHEHVDTSEIAKIFGGGGHKKASGFRLDRDALAELGPHGIDGIFDGFKDKVNDEQ